MPLISVIIPSFKPGEYVFKCINSIREQTIDDTKFEVVIVLNGHKEPYFTQISEFIKSFKNIKLIYCTESGVSNARNIGLSEARGEYITFIDDDDYISPTFLEELYNILENDQTVDVVQSNFKAESNGEIKEDYISKAYNDLYGKPFRILTFRKFLSSICGKLYRREVISDVRFNTKLKISEDSVFLFQISNNIKKMALSNPDSIYFRNIRVGSALRTKRTTKEIFRNFQKKTYNYSLIYFKNPLQYSFMLYLSRLAAIIKILFSEIYSNSRL